MLGPAMIRTVSASTANRFFSQVSYLPSDPTFFVGDAKALLRESYMFVRRNSHAYVSGA